jgi:hypothetical protein
MKSLPLIAMGVAKCARGGRVSQPFAAALPVYMVCSLSASTASRFPPFTNHRTPLCTVPAAFTPLSYSGCPTAAAVPLRNHPRGRSLTFQKLALLTLAGVSAVLPIGGFPALLHFYIPGVA